MRGTRTEILTCESICGLKTSFLHTALPEKLEIPVSTCPYWRQLLSLLLSSHFHLSSSESISLSIPVFGTIQFPPVPRSFDVYEEGICTEPKQKCWTVPSTSQPEDLCHDECENEANRLSRLPFPFTIKF